MDVLIVGGGPGGLAVIRGYREAGRRGTVLLVSADEHPPYARPPLTKDYLRGESEPVPAGRRGCVGDRRNAAACGPVGLGGGGAHRRLAARRRRRPDPPRRRGGGA